MNETLDQRVVDRTAALEASAAKLREANEKKDEFLATLAHELRNPLAPIRNAARIVKAKCGDLPELQWATDVIDRQVRTMSRLIEDLMDFSRINNGRFELRRETTDVNEVVNEAVEVAQPLIAECSHALEVKKLPGALLVDADKARVAQALVNLLSNAAKYSEPKGKIIIRTRLDGKDVVVSVRDTGIGIAPAAWRRSSKCSHRERQPWTARVGASGSGWH